MDFKYDDESRPYTSVDAFEDLEKIREILHDAKKRINKEKLKTSDIDISINIDIPKNNN